jgi:hypothetical protein
MTADEIRKMCSLGPRKWWHSFGLTGRMQAFCLMEIAAQLAERNEKAASDYAILGEQMNYLKTQMDAISEELKKL